MLKDGCPVMLLRNLDPSRGLCNGTRLQVKSVARHVVFCTYLDRERAGPRAPADGVVLLPRICCRSSEDGSFVEFDRKQFPIRVCFAMTINKNQGQSLGRVGVYLNPDSLRSSLTASSMCRLAGLPTRIGYGLQTTVLRRMLMAEACSMGASRTLSMTRYFGSF
jgi:hypothetical protein